MSVKFAAADSSRLSWVVGAALAYPWTVGLWVRPAATGALRTFWFFGNTAAADEYFSLGQTAANAWAAHIASGGAEGAETWGTVVAGEWTHILARFISATNRRYSALKLNGGFEQGAFTTSRIVDMPANQTEALGCRQLATPDRFFDGDIAEFFFAEGDMALPAAANIDRNLHARIAFGGPFSWPPLAYQLREYWSFRAGFRQLMPPDAAFRTHRLHTWSTSTTPPGIGADRPPAICNERRRRALFGRVPLGAVIADRRAGIEWLGGIPSSPAAAIEAVIALASARNAAAEFLQAAGGSRTVSAAWGAAARGDLAASIEARTNLTAGRNAYAEALVAVAGGGRATGEALAGAAGSRMGVLEVLVVAVADGAASIEAQGTAQVVAVGVVNLESLRETRATAKAMAETVALLGGGGAIGGEALGALAASRPLAANWGGLVAAEHRAVAEWLRGVAGGAPIAAAWRASVVSVAALPAAWRAGAVVDRRAVIEWLRLAGRGQTIPAEWGALIVQVGSLPVENLALAPPFVIGNPYVFLAPRRDPVLIMPARKTAFLAPRRTVEFKKLN